MRSTNFVCNHSAVFDDLQRRSTTFATLNHLFENGSVSDLWHTAFANKINSQIRIKSQTYSKKNDLQCEACDRFEVKLVDWIRLSMLYTDPIKRRKMCFKLKSKMF